MLTVAIGLCLLAGPPWLHVDGTRIADEAGSTVQLRGVNLGGWLLDELWLTGIRPWSLEDDAGVRKALAGRFGAAKAADLIRTFQESYLTGADFDLLQETGINCVRLPFYYRVLEDDAQPYRYLDSGWEKLDFAVAACAARGIYAILDLHGAPGAQSSNQSTGEAHRNALWTNEEYLARTAALWQAVASRYRDEPAVAGFDLLNEPWGNYENDPLAQTGHPTRDELLGLYDRIHAAIRSVDPRHLIILENRLVAAEELPRPADRGWTGIVYEFHDYCFDCTDIWGHKAMVDDRTRRYGPISRDRGTPVLLGEYFPASPEGFEYYDRQFDENGWSWTSWTYKCWYGAGADRWWGYLTRISNDEVWLDTEPLASIEAKFKGYGLASCRKNADLLDVVSRHARTPPAIRQRTGYFEETFSAADGSAPEDTGKIHVASTGGSASIVGGKLRLVPAGQDWGTAYVVPLARPEAAARFDTAAGTVVLSAAIARIDVATTSASDYEAELKLGLFRDPVEGDPWAADTEGIQSIVDFDRETNKVLVRVHEKRAAQDNGPQLNPGTAKVTFQAGASWTLEVGATTCRVLYGGKVVWSGAHGLRPAAWTGGGFATIGVQHYSSQRIRFAEIDDFTVRAGGPVPLTGFEDDFTGVAGLSLRASGVEKWASSWSGTATYGAIGGVRLIPPGEADGAIWLRPLASYWQDASFDLGSDALRIEAKVTSLIAKASGAGPEGGLRLSFLPEARGSSVLSHTGPAVFAEALLETAPAPSTVNLKLDRRDLTGGPPAVLASATRPYAPGAVLALSLGPSAVSVEYAGEQVLRAEHGLDLAASYPRGAWPLVEAANGAGSNRIEATFARVAILHAADCAPFIRGDANVDGAVDLADPLKILWALFLSSPLSCAAAADSDGDGQISVTDAIYLLAYLFSGGAAPPP